jgi:hypothetical protein
MRTFQPPPTKLYPLNPSLYSLHNSFFTEFDRLYLCGIHAHKVLFGQSGDVVLDDVATCHNRGYQMHSKNDKQMHLVFRCR